MTTVESLVDKNKEKGYLYDLYCKEKKVIDESKIKDSIKEFFADKKIDDLDIKETSMEKLGKCIVDISWGFSENKKLCKSISIKVFGQDNLIMSNEQGDIRVKKENWKNKKNMKKKIDEVFKNPILRSKNSFVDACH